ncbi:MAG: SprT-like domain-containing protein [Propionibacteriaceae bacterium]|nr:SprT-like domain-containing protein [Propionibacteriaceae bacterium]
MTSDDMATAKQTLVLGADLVHRHLGGSWSFGLDHARTRLGCCHYCDKTITCSRYLVAYLADDEVEQVILHEIAHGLAGPRAGHGRVWKQQARALGYDGGRTIEVPEARLSARWRGVCSAGHEVLRHRRPSGPVHCGACARAGVRRAITWQDRGLDLLARG